MEKDEIITFTRKAIEQSLAGLETENSKFDFKLRWYDLSKDKGKNEFVKDTTAIANTFGPDGFIVIGYNDKSKQFENSPFINSGLKDTSEIIGVINKKVDRVFNCDLYEMQYNDLIICIIHIPPSIDKPNVIREYKSYQDGNLSMVYPNKIFVRNGTTTITAGKNDIELMYYDRKNVLPEYRVVSNIRSNSVNLVMDIRRSINERRIETTLLVNFENIGYRPVSIS